MRKALAYLIILFVVVGLSGILYILNFNQSAEKDFSNQNINLTNTQNLNQEQSKAIQDKNVSSLDIESQDIKNQTIQLKEKNFYSLLEVLKHNSKESCWTVIRKGVYDLTNWLSKHPGGEKAILNICGQDGTVLFEKQHGGKDKPELTLLQFKIGELLE